MHVGQRRGIERGSRERRQKPLKCLGKDGLPAVTRLSGEPVVTDDVP
jgi:hypothetical protein